MGAELPIVSAVVARLPNPEVNLAAYGGVVFPLALIIESPIIMLLAASTALSKDWASYRKVRSFMIAAGALLTAIHILIAFTPLYYVVAVKVIGVPQEVVEPARIGLMIMTPWTWAIAYRRFNQGVLIRFKHSTAVGLGTVVRLVTNGTVLATGYMIHNIPGIVVGASAVAVGVVSEAVYVGIVVHPVLQHELSPVPPADKLLSWRSFFAFYIPLVMTSLLIELANPIGSAALSRMPNPLASLAVWPVITGFIFILQGLGTAYNEVVVATLDQPRSYLNLKRFTTLLSAVTSAGLLIIAVTPLSAFWFGTITALPPDLSKLAQRSLWLALPMPALTVLQSWYQGAILHGRRTRGITESVVIYLLATAAILSAGVMWRRVAGLYVGLAALTLSTLIQVAWLWHRSHPVLTSIRQRDLSPIPLGPQPDSPAFASDE